MYFIASPAAAGRIGGLWTRTLPVPAAGFCGWAPRGARRSSPAAPERPRRGRQPNRAPSARQSAPTARDRASRRRRGLNGIVGEQEVLDPTTLPRLKMPNRDGFVSDPRPDIPAKKRN